MSKDFGPIYSERIKSEGCEALVNSISGIPVNILALGEQFEELTSEDPDAGMVSTQAIDRLLGSSSRWPGLRDEITVGHYIAADLRMKLQANPDAIPAADPEIIALLEKQPGYAFDGKIVTIDGVPLPAGEAQTRYFFVLRYFSFYSPFVDPARIYCGDTEYDAAHATDEMQEYLFIVSTRIYLDMLIKLQKGAPGLFVALWLRQNSVIDGMVAKAPAELLPSPLEKFKLSGRDLALIFSDFMFESERVVEVFYAVRFEGGVTLCSLMAALNSSTSMVSVSRVDDAAHHYILGAAAHIRVMHPTMNDSDPNRGTDAIFETVANGLRSAGLYRKGRDNVKWVCGAKPARFFLGVEPMMLIPVALIQMSDNMARHAKNFWLKRGKKAGADAKGIRQKAVMSLAVVMMANVCVPSARRLANDKSLLSDELWLRQTIRRFIFNPSMMDELEDEYDDGEIDRRIHSGRKATKLVRTSSDDEEVARFKSAYARAKTIASKCSPKIGEPGWTQGFRFDAWRQPLAEVDFLRKCCRYVQFDPELERKRYKWTKPMRNTKGPHGQPIQASEVHTGLPQQHPLERIQDYFRPDFDRLQVAEQIKGHTSSDAYALREALIAAIAHVLACLSPATDDPQLRDRLWVDITKPNVRIAVEGAWNS